MNTTPASIAKLIEDTTAAGGTVEKVDSQRYRIGVPFRTVGGGTAVRKFYVAWTVQHNGRALTAGTKAIREALDRF
jgi:hypothetical protein